MAERLLADGVGSTTAELQIIADSAKAIRRDFEYLDAMTRSHIESRERSRQPPDPETLKQMGQSRSQVLTVRLDSMRGRISQGAWSRLQTHINGKLRDEMWAMPLTRSPDAAQSRLTATQPQ